MTTRSDKGKRRLPKPATTVEGRENQLISLAVDLAEKQLINGSASAQVISHFIKQGSIRESLERDRLKRENELLTAKVEQMASNQRVEALYDEAISAMRSYAGHDPEPDYDEEYGR